MQEFWLPRPKSSSSHCQHGGTSQASSGPYSWASSTGGFVPPSWSDRFLRGVGLGAQQADGLPFLPFHLTFLPFSLSIVSPGPPPPPRSGAGQGLSFPYVSLVPLQGQPGPEGSPGAKGYPGRQVQYMASGSSVAVVVWSWPRVPPGRGRWQAGDQAATPAGWALKKGLFKGAVPRNLL